jgi:O-antigen ligase
MNLVALGLLGLLFLRPHPSVKREKKSRAWKAWVIRIFEAIFLLVMFAGLVRVAGTKNAFFARLWGYWMRDSKTSLSGYFEYLGFGARFVYGTAAYNTYSAHPVLGVGLGNYAFYFEEMLPDRPLGSMPELLRIITPEAGRNRLITAKVLYLRLLAETGLIGTAAFFAFLVAVLGCALYLWLSPDHDQKFWGRAGLLGMAAFLLGALSFDSFAIPNMWIVFGLITSSAWVYLRQPAAEAKTIPGEPVEMKTFVPAQGD